MPTTPRTERQASHHLRALGLLEQLPDLTQRQLAEALGISVGQTNYLLKALLDKGQVKLGNFQRGDQKLKKLAYLFTPAGLQQRLTMTRAYLARKTQEYAALHAEHASLRAELGEPADPDQPADPVPVTRDPPLHRQPPPVPLRSNEL